MTHSAKGFKAPPKLFPVGLVSVFFLVLWSASAQVQTAPEPGPRVARTSGNFIVTFQPGTSQADRAASVRRAGATLRSNYSIVDAVAVTIPNTNVYAALQQDPSVLEIIPDRPVHAFQAGESNGKGKPGGGGGDTSGQITPAGVQRVGLSKAGSDGTGMGIAIVDTGIDFAQTDLAPAPNASGTAFSDFGSSCQDDNGHGTHVTGIVAALNNTIGVVGVAPNATPYCVKVLDSTGSGSDSTVMAGLDWVGLHATSVNPPIRVVNMSLGRDGTLGDNTALRASVQALYNSGIVVVVAAGNDETLEVSQNVPATYPEVLAVASTTAIDGKSAKCAGRLVQIRADTASFFTTDGAFNYQNIGVTISAPGEDKEDVRGCVITSVGILSLKAGGGTTRKQGTSMATPHVSGIVARLIQAGYAGVENIRSTIRTTADRIGIAPLNSPTTSYTFDREREGIAQAP